MSDTDNQPPENREELLQTVEALEQILEVMPEDPFTLRALYETQLKLHEPQKAFDCLTRLDEVARSLQDGAQIEFVIDQYQSIVDDMPDVRHRIERLEELKLVAGLIEENESGDLKGGGTVKGGIEPEMSLAWDLLQDDVLSQEEYSDVIHDLTEMSSNSMDVPVTVLHVLHDRNFSRFERLMSHLSQKSGIPIMSISQYDEKEGLESVLPANFMTRFGILPFAEVGDELLVAVLNPLDRERLEQASSQAGRRCHAYLTSPQEYDQRLAQVKKTLAGS